MLEVNCEEIAQQKWVDPLWFNSPVPALFTCLGPETNLITKLHIDEYNAPDFIRPRGITIVVARANNY